MLVSGVHMLTSTNLEYCPDTGVLTEDSKWLGSMDPSGYYKFKRDEYNYFVHRVCWYLYYGRWPIVVDHINGDRADNRLDNLREVSQQENSKNCAISANNTSGFNGVYWNKLNRKWIANICVSRRTIYLGSYAALEDAIAHRVSANKVYGFHTNHGRKAN